MGIRIGVNMKRMRLLIGICAGLAGIVILLITLLFMVGWSTEVDKEWSFLLFIALGFIIVYLLFLFARWCVKRRSQDEPTPQEQVVEPSTPPPPLPVPESVLAMGDVGKALFALNNTDVPFHVIVGDGEEADLIAEWNLADAKWRDLLMAAGIKKVFRIFLKLDHSTREVRALDREYELNWNAGMPVLSEWKLNAGASVQVFRGREHKKEYQAAFRIEDVIESLLGLLGGKWVPPRPIYEYKFNTGEIKTPIINAVTACGWTLKQVAFGKL